jgi:hypothetical protein
MSTKKHGPTNVNKHPSAIHGTIEKGKKKKRRRSSKGEEEKQRKRERIELSGTSGSDLEAISSDSNSESRSSEVFEMASGSEPRSLGADIRAEIVSALGDEKIIEMLSKAFAKQIVKDLNEEVKELKTEVEGLKRQGSETKVRMDTFDNRLDKFEQNEKANNVIATGIPADKTSKEGIRKLLNNKLSCNIAPSDIQYTLELNKDEENAKSTVRIAFNNKDKKKQVMKSKKALKGNEIWLGDDLTKYRSDIAFHARKAVKGNKISQTWVTGGTVFIKKTENAKPIKINNICDIPGYVAQ